MAQSLAEAQAGSETRVFLGRPSRSFLTASSVLSSQMSSEKPAAAIWGTSTPVGAHLRVGPTLPVWVATSPLSAGACLHPEGPLTPPRGPSHTRPRGTREASSSAAASCAPWLREAGTRVDSSGGVWMPPGRAGGLGQPRSSSTCTPGVPTPAGSKLWRGFYRPQRLSLTHVPPWALETDKKGVAGESAKGVSEQLGFMTVSTQFQILDSPICLTSFSSDASKLALLVSTASWFQQEN